MYHAVSITRKEEVTSGKKTKMKTIKETYLVESMSVTESEAKLTAWLPDSFQEVSVDGSKVSNLQEVIKIGDSEDYYLLGIKISLDEGTPKQTNSLINGTDLLDALKKAHKYFNSDTIADVDFRSITASKMLVEEELVTVTESVLQ